MIIIFLSRSIGFAQEPIGGPYTVDTNTVLLLHFNDNLNNESPLSANGVGHGTYYYLPSPLGSGMGKCLRFKNDALSDSSYVTVAHNPNLNLTGDWTIEGWINVFTFGTAAGDHRWVPRLCIKPGDEIFWRPNWWVELWGDNRLFQTGFHTADQRNWPAVNSANNVMVPGQWVHLTFIRDNSRKILVQMVHNQSRQLIWFGTMSYAHLPVTTPLTNSRAVHIGFAGGGNDSWLDGFVDEIRISNIVRNFAVPPIITNVTELTNQPDYVSSYQVKAKIEAFHATGTITSARIYYTTNKGTTWLTSTMTKSGDFYVGNIPKLPFGTIIQYYISATDNYGTTSTYPSAGRPYLTFAIFKYNMLVLHLDFEEGTGTPIDKSSFRNPVTSPRPFVYSTDAKVGRYSILMQPDATPKRDSSFLEVDAPFLSASDFNVSLWFKVDTIKPFVRIINRPLVYGNWWQNNYEIRFQDLPYLRARYYVDPNAPNKTQDYIELDIPDSIKIKKWYKVLFKRDSTKAIFQLYDENANLIREVKNDTSVYKNPPIQPNAPLRIGNGGNVNGERGVVGRIDEVKIYNNFEGITTGVKEDNALPTTYELYQNYPNPFNPSTVISYQLSAVSYVTLKVYDILGKGIETLVDEVLEPGIHHSTFHIPHSAFTSGVYFYQLRAGSHVGTKKMVLLK
jgi:hypothetical protein